MPIDLRHKNPKDNEQINENVTQISEQALSKDIADIDTASISSPVSATYEQSEIEALRNTVLTLINNLKGS